MKINEQIIEYIEDSIQEQIEFIQNRADVCNLSIGDRKNLYDSDYLLYDDPEDTSNHFYDLGKLDGLKDVKCFIKNKYKSLENTLEELS